MDLQVHAFVTRETSPISLETSQKDDFKMPRILSSLNNAEASKHPMSMVAGAGSNMWITACFLASLLGYIIVYLLINYFVVQRSFSESVPRWFTGLFNVISMVLGVVVFGGTVVSLWSFLGRLQQDSSGAVEENVHLLSNDGTTTYADECTDRLVHPSNTYFGHRPNLRGMRDFSLLFVCLLRPW